MSNLYDRKEFFRLVHNGTTTYIDEPVGWDNIKIGANRDPKYYGYTSEFVSEDSNTLTFPPDEGGNYIRALVDAQGFDVQVIFEFGIMDSNVPVVYYSGQLIFEDYEVLQDKDGITCPVEKHSFEQLLRTRADVKIAANATMDLDNNSITPPEIVYLQMHSREIVKITQVNWDVDQSLGYAEIFLPEEVWSTSYVLPDTNSFLAEELEEVQVYDLGISKGVPSESSLFIYDAKESGTLSIKYIFDGVIAIENSGVLDAYVVAKVERAGLIINESMLPVYLGATSRKDPFGNPVVIPFWVSGQTYNQGSIVRHGNAPVMYYRCKFDGFSSSTPPSMDAVNWDTISEEVALDATPNYGHTEFMNQTDIDGNPYLFYLEVQRDDKVYLYLKFNHDDVNDPDLDYTLDPDIFIDNYTNEIEFKQYTTLPPSRSNAYRIFDLLNYTIQATTGKQNRLISSFFSEDGDGYNYVLLNGYAVRNFEVDEHPMAASWKQLIEGLHSIFNLGVGYKTIAGVDYVIIEPMLHFYGNKPVLQVPSVHDYSELTQKDMIYNQFDIGYNKFAQDDFNSLDDFHTVQEHMLPIRSIKKRMTHKTELIASGYIIEQMRRDQYQELPTTSLEYDDDIFIVAVVPKTIYKGVVFDTIPGNDAIYFARPLGMQVGDIFTLRNNVTNNNRTFTITEKLYADSDGYKVISTPNAATGDVTDIEIEVAFPADTVVAEKDQNFEILTGIISPETVYNARISPKHNLYNFAPLLKISLTYNDDEAVIRNNFTKNNGNLTTKFVIDDPHKMFVYDQTLTEKNDQVKSDFSDAPAPHIPVLCKFKAVLGWEYINLLRQTLFGQTGTDKDHGYIIAPDDRGVLHEMHVYKLAYLPATEEVELECAKIRKYELS